ncbi:MAG TPA: PIG-L deacetylase family protein [Acidimicrobiales bacterium]|nr:PIG-L deacetylase family protein [Acidimicrobiales bacterium]
MVASSSETSWSGPSGLPVGDLPVEGPPSTDLAIPDSALAIGAHPDDIEFGCAATLAKWARAGCRVHHLVLTDGSKGSWDPDRQLSDLAAERRAECLAAADIIDGAAGPGAGAGAGRDDRVIFLDRVDGELEAGTDERRAVCRIIRAVRPSVILGHDPWRRYRLHPDHRAAGFLTIDALVAARDPHFFPELGLSPHRLDALLLWEPDQPNHVEDVGGFEKDKIQALLCHLSQQKSTMGIDPTGARDAEAEVFATRVRHQLRAHGAVASVPVGEAFHLMTDL